MAIFLASFLIVCLAVLGMAVGALAGRRPITAGCGSVDCIKRSGIGCGACNGANRDADEPMETSP